MSEACWGPGLHSEHWVGGAHHTLETSRHTGSGVPGSSSQALPRLVSTLKGLGSQCADVQVPQKECSGPWDGLPLFPGRSQSSSLG